MKLKDIGQSRSGATPSRGEQDRYFTGGQTPWVKTLDLNNAYIVDTDENVTAEAIKETSLTIHPIGTLLVAMYGGYNQIGRTGLLTVPATTNQAISAVRLDPKKVEPYYALQALNTYRYLWRRYAASSRKDPNITREDVDAFKIPLPPLPTQRRIAAILQTWDRAIALAERQLADLQERKRGLMHVLLTGEKRLPEFEGAGEWGMGRLGTIAELRTGNTPSRSIPEYWQPHATNPWLSIRDMKSLYISATKECITNLAVEETSAKCEPIGTLLMSFKLSIGKVAIAGVPLFTNEAIVSINPHKGIVLRDWLLYVLPEASARIGGGQAIKGVTLNQSDLAAIKIPLPTTVEQEAIIRVLDAAMVSESAKKTNIDLLRRQKKGLMQRLLSGEVEPPADIDDLIATPRTANLP